jgi:response regulator NasT
LESALIVSYSEKSLAFFTDMLRSISCDKIVTTATCGDARRMLLERDFDLCIINAPLSDETGENLSRHISSKGISQVILVVHVGYYDEVSNAVEDYGVITVSKPLNKNLFWSALKLAKAAQNKLKVIKAENNKLTQKIEDIRIIDRAKCILISYLNMSEPEAHKYIEKQAMDMRITKRAVAEGILKTYES